MGQAARPCHELGQIRSRMTRDVHIVGGRVMDRATSIQLRLFVRMVAISVLMAVLGFTLLTRIF
jgi:hypothetical protein